MSTKKVTRVYFREAAYIGSYAAESIPPVEQKSSPKAADWSVEELPNGDVLVRHRTFVRGGVNGALKHVVCNSRVPAANVRSVSYEDEDIVEQATTAKKSA
jgi:hypothetical protein